MDAYKLTISEASAKIRDGGLTPMDLTRGLLGRINKLEDRLEAWVTVDSGGSLAAAEMLTEESEEGRLRGPLHGIPVGVKDIYYTRGLLTTMGSAIYEAFIPDHDAATVKTLREAGAVVLGKTETTEFALTDPAPTRNPWNLEHTPGGSSSGSAAAVSAGMCPMALGSQTGGSVIRPASFCGIVGLKPTYDLLSREGVYPLSWSLDHVGFFTRTVEDASIVLDAMAGTDAHVSLPEEPDPPRMGVLGEYFMEKAEEAVWAGFMDAVERLRDAGAEAVEVPLPESFRVLHHTHRVIMSAEAAAVHQENFTARMGDYRPHLRGLVASGMLVPSTTYLKAQRIRAILIQDMLKAVEGFDCLVTPSSLTPALRGLESTGDSSFNSPWSITGFPSITLPSGLTGDGLPLGVQLSRQPYGEAGLLAAASWCEGVLGFPHEPRELG